MDIIAAANAAVAHHSVIAPAFALAAGVATSIGPCSAPRMIAAIGLAGRESSLVKRVVVLTALVCGLCCAYVAIASAVNAVAQLMHRSTLLYAGFSVVFVGTGVLTVARAQKHRCAQHRSSAQPSTSLGGAFLAGASMGLLVSPCCTPIIAAMAGLGGVTGRFGYEVATIGAFALGHSLPLVVAGLGAGAMRERFARFETSVGTIGGALLMGLGAYYAVLA